MAKLPVNIVTETKKEKVLETSTEFNFGLEGSFKVPFRLHPLWVHFQFNDGSMMQFDDGAFIVGIASGE